MVLTLLELFNWPKSLGPGHTIVTVAVDTGLKYLAGDLFSLEQIRVKQREALQDSQETF